MISGDSTKEVKPGVGGVEKMAQMDSAALDKNRRRRANRFDIGRLVYWHGHRISAGQYG